ncbi:hypothetical protein BJX66DRAFT_329348 [Aspergillus keveii]|uniref:Uncharacterized protein n=1 Tax=Aspergillus keveii TaxID=714993 RepID=A0ABR4FQ36_9EURO
MLGWLLPYLPSSHLIDPRDWDSRTARKGRVLFSPSDGLRKHEDAEGAEYCGRWYHVPFYCGITGLGACVGPDVTVVAREIDVDYASDRTSVRSGHVREIWQNRSSGLTTPFRYSGGDPLVRWSRGVGHCCVSVQPPMTRLNVKIQEREVIA